MITNRAANRVKSDLTPEQFAEAVQSLDLDAIPPEKRAHAMAAHLGRIMYETLEDSANRHKLAHPSLLLPRA